MSSRHTGGVAINGAGGPTWAAAWFVPGSIPYAHSTAFDAKGRFIVTVETRQAIEKHLEPAASGPHAADVMTMLDYAAK
ncbi:MAG: hypothetical protein ACRD3N_10255 [Terracidiphilus sp.]